MKKIGEINCGCSDNCDSRTKIYWSRKEGVCYREHGEFRRETADYGSRKFFHQAIEDCVAWYRSSLWEMQLSDEAMKALELRRKVK